MKQIPIDDDGRAAQKAELLYSLSKFVQWPNGSLSDTFSIQVVGDEHFYEYLNYVYAGRKIKERPVKVIFTSNEQIVETCQILYISHNSYALTMNILHKAGSKPILLVSEEMDIHESGMMVNFRHHEEEMMLEVNPDAAQAAGLNIGYQLLQVATKILKKQNK